MTGTLILVGLLPLVVFVLLDAFAGPKVGIISAMILGVALGGVCYFVLDDFDYTVVLEVGLIIGLGLVALKFKNPKFFKFQPVVIGVCLALFLGWFQYFDEPYLLKLLPRMAKLMPESKTLSENARFLELLGTLSGQLIYLFLGHAALVAYSAVKWNNLGWILTRLAIYPLMLGLVLLNV